jgi:hypothetical protein
MEIALQIPVLQCNRGYDGFLARLEGAHLGRPEEGAEHRPDGLRTQPSTFGQGGIATGQRQTLAKLD